MGSRQAGFSEEELLATGLAQRSKQRPGSYYDRFRERIMFPLANARGRVVGFGARAMRDNQPPKYLNSSDGEVFHKSQQLFGIDLARRPAARAGTIVLAEGYTDVLALHQAGIENAVGVMGTSLTEEQARELERTARTLVLALDADGAGQEAMVRASRIAAGRRLELRVARLADGMDPADLVQQQGPGAVRELVAKSVPFVSFHVDKILAGSDLGDAEGKDRAIAELGPVLAAQPPSVLREELVGRIAGRIGIDRALAAQLLERAAAEAPPEQPAAAPEPAAGPASAGASPARVSAAAPPAGPTPADPGPEWHDPGPDESWGGPSADDEAAYWASRTSDDDSAYAAAADAGQVASTRAPVAVRADPRQLKLEREFLVLCIALPREGGQALARVDREQHLLDPISAARPSTWRSPAAPTRSPIPRPRTTARCRRPTTPSCARSSPNCASRRPEAARSAPASTTPRRCSNWPASTARWRRREPPAPAASTSSREPRAPSAPTSASCRTRSKRQGRGVAARDAQSRYHFRAARSLVAQLAEHSAVNRRVVGSSPTQGASETPVFAGVSSLSG